MGFEVSASWVATGGVDGLRSATGGISGWVGARRLEDVRTFLPQILSPFLHILLKLFTFALDQLCDLRIVFLGNLVDPHAARLRSTCSLSDSHFSGIECQQPTNGD